MLPCSVIILYNPIKIFLAILHFRSQLPTKIFVIAFKSQRLISVRENICQVI